MLKTALLLALTPIAIFGNEVTQNQEDENSIKWYSIGTISDKKQTPEKEEEEEEEEKETCKNNSSQEKEENDEKSEEDTRDKCSRKGPDPWMCGNFSLPVSQHIAPLSSFGQLVIDREDLLFYFAGDAVWGHKNYQTDLSAAILYGITDDLVAYVRLPFSTGGRDDDHYSAGLEDIYLQFEYAYYTFNTRCNSTQATIVSSVYYPSGSPKRNPPTGFGAPSFFIGSTFSHESQKDYYFLCLGALFPTDFDRSKIGDEYFYQCGYEHVISASRCRYIFAWMIELNGLYSRKDRKESIIDPDSGGNQIAIIPSLFFSTRRWIYQAGIIIPAIQNRHGTQNRENLGVTFLISWTS